jgi:hypothetical protein
LAAGPVCAIVALSTDVFANGMASFDSKSTPANVTDDIWRDVWSGLEIFVADFRELCGSHLRDMPLDLRLLSDGRSSHRGLLSVGSTELVLDCPRRAHPPSRAEVTIARAFGAVRPLVRIFVLRKLAYASYGWQVEATLVADPVSRTWIATEPELGPASLADFASLQSFFWYLVIDRRA